MKRLMLAPLCAFCLLSANAKAMVAQDTDVQNKSGNPTGQKNPADKKSAASDSWVGSWKMDVKKSKLHGPTPQEETLVIESATASQIKYAITSVGASGQYTITYGGKPDTASPLLIDGKEAGTATYHRINSRQYSGKSSMANGLTTTEMITLSPDHKKTIVKVHAKGKDGEYEEIVVYTR